MNMDRIVYFEIRRLMIDYRERWQFDYIDIDEESYGYL